MPKETMIIIFLYHHIALLNKTIEELHGEHAFLVEDHEDLKEDVKRLKKKLDYEQVKHLSHACP